MNEIQTGLIITVPGSGEKYSLIRKLGQGGFGEVWLANRLGDKHHRIAIKFFKLLHVDDRKLFLAEYQRSANFHHEDVLPSLFYGEWNSRLFMGMEFCEFGTAAQFIGNLNPNKKGDEALIWNFIYDTASGLQYLHEVENVVHQDIKPDNVMINSEGDFVIMDFGISVCVNSDIQLSNYCAFGSPAYMAPERFSDSKSIIYANDIWSLGVSIYEMAVGVLPFNGMGGEYAGVELPSLPNGWSDQLNKVMQSCFVHQTWLRKRAVELKQYAEWILNGKKGSDPWDGYIPQQPDSLINNIQNNQNSQSSSSIKGKSTQRNASNNNSGRDTMRNSLSQSNNNSEVGNSNNDVRPVNNKSKNIFGKISDWANKLLH